MRSRRQAARGGADALWASGASCLFPPLVLRQVGWVTVLKAVLVVCVLGHKSDFILASEHPGAEDSAMKYSKWTCSEVENGDVVQIKSDGA